MRAAILLGLLAGCTATIPSGRYRCATTAECPPQMECLASLCVLGAGMDGGSMLDAARDTGLDAPADAGSDAPVCAPVTIQAEADTSLVPTDCNGSISLGGHRFMNLSTGLQNVGLFRFPLHADTRSALLEGRVTSATLLLSPTTDCEGPPCPSMIPGTICARIARSDWVEGPAMETTYGGADWCRRGMDMAGAPWDGCATAAGSGCGASGVNAGPTQTCATWNPLQAMLSVSLDAVALRDEMNFDISIPGELTFRLEPTSNLVFLAATHETTTSVAPTLQLVVCH